MLALLLIVLLLLLLLLLPSSAQSPQAQEHSCLWFQAEHVPEASGWKCSTDIRRGARCVGI
jgi:hypothetical protein